MTKDTSGIYMITSPNGKSYIGRAINLKNRLNKYKNNHNNEQPLIYNAIKKYGYDNMKITILWQTEIKKDNTNEILNQLESLYILKHNTFTPNGYNLTTGGDACKLSEATKLKVGLKSKEHHANVTSENRENRYKNFRDAGVNTRYKKGSKRTKEQIDFLNNCKYKRINQYSKDNLFIKEWDSIKQAADELKLDRTSISHNLIGNSKTSYGYIWKYK